MEMLNKHPLSVTIDPSQYTTVIGYRYVHPKGCPSGVQPMTEIRLLPDEDRLIFNTITSSGRSELLTVLQDDLQSLGFDKERGQLVTASIPEYQFLEILAVLSRAGYSAIVKKLLSVLTSPTVSSVGFDWKKADGESETP